MISATMVSGKVISCEGSAASRRRMVEYWLWSATHMSTGFGEFTNGSQNCLKTGGRDACHRVAEAITRARPTSANASILPTVKIRFVRGSTESVELGWDLMTSEPLLGDSSEVAGRP